MVVGIAGLGHQVRQVFRQVHRGECGGVVSTMSAGIGLLGQVQNQLGVWIEVVGGVMHLSRLCKFA